MGKEARQRPKKLADKLLQIRHMLGLSQDGIIEYLGLTGEIERKNISNYEKDKREPNSLIVLAYARAAKVSVDFLLDDSLYLPSVLASNDTKTTKKGGSPLMTAKLLLQLDIESINGLSKNLSKVRAKIEKQYLKKFSMKKVANKNNQYELEIKYTDEADLKRVLFQEIIKNIYIDAADNEYKVDWEAWDKDTMRHW